jgi:hypothetical protein
MGNPPGRTKRKRQATNNKSEMWNSSSKKKRGSSSSGFNADDAEKLFQEIADEDDDQVAGMEGTVGNMTKNMDGWMVILLLYCIIELEPHLTELVLFIFPLLLYYVRHFQTVRPTGD